MNKIAPAFIKAKQAFSPALKTATNPHFKSRYSDLAACVEAVDDAFLENGIVMYQETSEDASGVTVETVLLHESGEAIRCGKLHVPASKQDPQGYGSALTYARRYSLMAACGIAPEDDDGNAASKSAPKANPVAAAVVKANAKPTAGAKDNLTAGQIKKVDAVASKVTDWLTADSIADAVMEKSNAHLDADESVYFWTLFDSKQRTAMTNEFSRQKTEQLNREAATQS